MSDAFIKLLTDLGYNKKDEISWSLIEYQSSLKIEHLMFKKLYGRVFYIILINDIVVTYDLCQESHLNNKKYRDDILTSALILYKSS